MMSLPRGKKTRSRPGWRWYYPGLRLRLRKPLVALRHRGLTPQDIVLGEFPKSGGTWLAFMLGELLFGEALDFRNQEQLAPRIGLHRTVPPAVPDGGRLVRTHEHWREEYRRPIYLVRHVGDVAVSYYHWLPWLPPEYVSFKTFLGWFLEGRVDAYGAWTDHVTGWLDSGADPYVVRYEDLRADPVATLEGILNWLDLCPPRHEVDAAVANNTLDAMKSKERATRQPPRRSRGQFVRQGSVGGHREWFDVEDLAFLCERTGPVLTRLGYTLPSRQ